MKYWPLIFVMLSSLLVGAIYFSSSPLQVFVEGVIDGGVTCSPQEGGKTYCCASVLDKNGYTSTTYCTTCDDTNPPSNCSPREKPKAVVNPGRDLSNILEGGILENPTTVGPNFSQKFGEILQAEDNLTFSQANISSGNMSSDILSLGQSDLVSGIPKNTSKSVGIGQEEKNEDGTTTDETIGEETDDDKNGDNGDEDKDDEDEEQPQG
jgi:hypothetical protein